jgi:hypothetical protein
MDDRFQQYALTQEWIDALPEHLRQPVPEIFYAPYGFKIVEIDGMQRWTMRTEDDHRETCAMLFELSDDDELPPKTGNCYNTGPYTCGGGCPESQPCQQITIGTGSMCLCF